MPDLVAGRYELVHKLGEGSVAEVFRAIDRELNRPVAIKFLREEAQAREAVRQRFVREARAIAKVSHPNLITVHDAGEADGRMFIVMELVEGRTFDQLIRERRLDPREAADLFRRAALGLHHAHEAGIIHRDLKPANVLITEGGEPKIVDFGLARMREGDSLNTKPGMILGTPRYMAPEQVRGDASTLTPATDVYALGAILHESLAGRPVHGGETTFDVINSVLNDEAEPVRRFNPAVPAPLEAIILKALEKAAYARYPSAKALADDLDRFLSGQAVAAKPPTAIGALAKTAGRHRAVAVSGLAIIALAAVAIGIIVNMSEQGARQRSNEEKASRTDRAREFAEAGSRIVEQLIAKKREIGYSRTEVAELAERAAMEFMKAHTETPEDPAVLTSIGRAWALAGKPDKALDFFERALRVSPGYVRACIERIRINVERYEDHRHNSGRILRESEKAKLLRVAIDEDLAAIEKGAKDAPERLYAKGVMAFAAGEYEGAERLLGEYLAGADGDAAAHYWRGHALVHLNQGPRAEECLSRALRMDTGHFGAWLNRGNVRATSRDFRGAIDDFTQALRVDPHASRALQSRSAAYADLKDWRAALQDIENALRLESESPEFLYSRGWILDRMGELDRAIADYTKASELSGGWCDPLYHRALLRKRKGDSPGALQDLDEALRLTPHHAEARVARGTMLLDRREFEAALADYNAVIAATPKMAMAYFWRGRVRRAMGDPVAAMDDYTRCIDLDPDFWNAWNHRALLRRDTGDIAGAVRDAETANRLRPDDAELLANLGNIRTAAKDYQGALAAYDKSLAIQPRSNVYYNRGNAKLDMKDADGAMADFNEAERLDPDNVEAIANRAAAHARKGDRAAAIADLEKALERAPRNWRYRESVTQQLRQLKGE